MDLYFPAIFLLALSMKAASERVKSEITLGLLATDKDVGSQEMTGGDPACCKCNDGSITWRASAEHCSRFCKKSGLALTRTPTKSCKDPAKSKSRKCRQECKIIVPELEPESAGWTTRLFSPADAKGGSEIRPETLGVLFIEYQNEFVTEGGKLHDSVKAVMKENDMLKKSVAVAKAVRRVGGKVFHAPITFSKDHSDNPNKGIGILNGCYKGELFTRGTWNAEFHEDMKPQKGDVLITGKNGLDAFPDTDLEAQLKANGIETLAFGGLLTNCCVEGTMRTAYEKGFNTIGLTDCTATNSKEGQEGSVNGTYGTYKMFSTPMTASDFMSKLAFFPDAPAPPAKPVKKFEKPWTRRYSSANAKGGIKVDASKTAVVFIEFQNEFATEGGKLHNAVKPVMEENDMLRKSAMVAEAVRNAGGKVFHNPITFNKDHSDNPNKGIGILNGCYKGELFTRNTWNGDFCDAVRPRPGDFIVTGKTGLDAFPGTDLEILLRRHEIETVAFAGFLTNCCVEGTMRTAYEMGFNTIGLTDCTATDSKEGQAASVNGTYGMFSTPMSAADFIDALKKKTKSKKTKSKKPSKK